MVVEFLPKQRPEFSSSSLMQANPYTLIKSPHCSAVSLAGESCGINSVSSFSVNKKTLKISQSFYSLCHFPVAIPSTCIEMLFHLFTEDLFFFFQIRRINRSGWRWFKCWSRHWLNFKMQWLVMMTERFTLWWDIKIPTDTFFFFTSNRLNWVKI